MDPDETLSRDSSRGARGRHWIAVAASIALSGLLLWAWSRPLPSAPAQMPPLVLEQNEVAAALEADAAAAQSVPSGSEAERRATLYREVNEAEVRQGDFPAEARSRRARLATSLEILREAHGQAAVDAVRADDVARIVEALRGGLTSEEAAAQIGGFDRMLAQYALVEGGVQRAPTFVIRTVFKARWNGVHGLELTDSFAPIERRAYWGWFALRARAAPLDARLSALDELEAAGGISGDAASVGEARGTLYLRAGDLDRAREAFAAAHEARGTFRLRNFALHVPR